MASIYESLSPAKVNLALAVTGRRADGYHELITLVTCVDLYDHIRFNFQSPDISICCHAAGVPADASNLACRAAARFRDALLCKTAIKSFGLRMDLTKRIPVGAGLGGGSSNAATVLRVLNRHFDHPMTPRELAALALPLGADVPYFLYGRPAIVAGIGEQIQPYFGLKPAVILIVFPGIGLSTGKVYAALNLRLTKCKKKLKKAPLKKSGFDASLHLCNDLESVTASNYPVINTIKEQLLKHGAVGALMSGSGPTVFGLFSDPGSATKAKDAFDPDIHVEIYLSKIIDKISFVDC